MLRVASRGTGMIPRAPGLGIFPMASGVEAKAPVAKAAISGTSVGTRTIRQADEHQALFVHRGQARERDFGWWMTTVRLLLVALCFLPFATATKAAINVSVAVTSEQCDDVGDVCPAPQTLFFDATATSCSAGECGTEFSANNSFRSLHYSWNFGDPGKGNWPTGAASLGDGHDKNVDYGPIAFHVYEERGTYTVRLTVTDGATTASWTQNVIIDDPDLHFSGTTRCIRRTATNWTGCPAGATQITDNSSNWSVLVNNALAAGDRRILFQDGGSYNTLSVNANVNGPVQISTFGTGGAGGSNRVTVTYNTSSGNILSGGLGAVERWTITNFDFVWDDVVTNGKGLLSNLGTCWNDFLSYKNSATNTVKYIGTFKCSANASLMSEDLFAINDGEIINGVGADGFLCNFYNAQRTVFAGTEFGSDCERDIRMSGDSSQGVMGPFIMSHNTHPATRVITGEAESYLDFRGSKGNPDTGTGGGRYLLIADGLFQTPNSHIQLRTCCYPGEANRTADVIIERNRFIASVSHGAVATPHGRRVTVRNNLVAGGTDGIFYKENTDAMGKQADHTWPKDNLVYNNTIFSTRNVVPIQFFGSHSGNECRNNVFYSTSGTPEACTGAVTDSDNASLDGADDVTITSNPFVGVPTMTGVVSDWELNRIVGGGLSVIDAGSPLQEVLSDALVRKRPDGPGYDIGALEMQSGPAATPPLSPFLLLSE